MKIALVDTDSPHSPPATQAMKQVGLACDIYRSVPKLVRAVTSEVYDVVLVAENLADQHGPDLIRQLRYLLGSTLIIIVVADDVRQASILAAFEAGATDYASSERPEELIGRMLSHHRRAQLAAASCRDDCLKVGRYELRRSTRSVYLDGVRLPSTPKEFDLAWFLFSSPGETIRRGHLESMIWGRVMSPFSRALDATVTRARRSLQLTIDNGVTIVSVNSVGYYLKVWASYDVVRQQELHTDNDNGEATPHRSSGKSPTLRLI